MQPKERTRILPIGAKEPNPVSVEERATYLRRNGNTQSGHALPFLSEVPRDLFEISDTASQQRFWGCIENVVLPNQRSAKFAGTGTSSKQCARLFTIQYTSPRHYGAHIFEKDVILTSVAISYPRKFLPISQKFCGGREPCKHVR